MPARPGPAALLLLALAGGTQAQDTRPADPDLRRTLTQALREDRAVDAIRAAQQALRERPSDPGVRREFVDLHLALAESWLAEHRYEEAEAALRAVLHVEPAQAAAIRALDQLRTARAQAGNAVADVERLLRLELFEAALDRVRQTQALRPDLAARIRPLEQAAWLGAADDHYLARNFPEAFALYEKLLAADPGAPPAVHSRWAAALACALAESDFSQPMDPNAAGRLLARAIDVLNRTREPILGQIIGGLLAERSGNLVDAGRTYAAALGIAWDLPPADRRHQRVADLRARVIQRTQELYRDVPTQRRDGLWAAALAGVWKERATPRFIVRAHSDLVAERVADAAEYHYGGLRQWLGASAGDWELPCTIHVHTTAAELHAATGAGGIAYAVSRTQLQGARVRVRELHVFQQDPWLLSSTLPHELTHLLAAELYRAALPLAIDEGLALAAEPPARRLMYRRMLGAAPPAPAALLAATELPDDVEGFYAESATLVSWLLAALGATHGDTAPERRPPTTSEAASGPAERDPVSRLLEIFGAGVPADWAARVGLASQRELEASWVEWYAARRQPHRMPLIILVEPKRIE